MNEKRDIAKGVRFHVTIEDIRRYRSIPPDVRLWGLEQQARLSYQGLTPERRRIWEKFRRGEI